MRSWVVAMLLASSCATPASLHDIVLDYDEAVSRAEAEMLLLNIARARHQRPVHFTTVSGIAATFEYRTSASVGGEIAENPGISILTPSFGVSASANPTISIVPIQGEEFTRRLLTPLDESIFGFFYHQGVDPVLLLRLIGRAAILEHDDGRRTVHSNGSDEFDRLLVQLGDMERGGTLDVGPLVFEEEWSVASDEAPSAQDLAGLIDQGYDYRRRETGGVLSRRVVGRHAITNYDSASIDNTTRAELQRRAQQYPGYFVLLDLRARSGETSGLRGWIKLRSVGAILDSVADAIARSDADAPLRVIESTAAIEESLFAVTYESRHYSLPRDRDDRNQTAFGVVYRLYQMSVSELPTAAVPSVTIAK